MASYEESLAGLSAEARQRVESAFKSALERETMAGEVGGVGAARAGHIFSRGWIFSRLTPAAVDLESIKGLPGLEGLSPPDFADFASRLAELKRKTDPS